MTLRRAAEQALAAIKSANQVNYSWACVEAVAVLEAALAEPNKCTHGVTDGNCKECYMAESEQEPVFDCPRCGHCCPQTEQEPFAYCYVRKGTSVDILTFDDNPKDAVSGTVFPLYLAPPQRKPLTDEHPLMVFAKECVLGAYSEKELADAANRAIKYAHSFKGEA